MDPHQTQLPIRLWLDLVSQRNVTSSLDLVLR